MYTSAPAFLPDPLFKFFRGSGSETSVYVCVMYVCQLTTIRSVVWGCMYNCVSWNTSVSDDTFDMVTMHKSTAVFLMEFATALLVVELVGQTDFQQ